MRTPRVPFSAVTCLVLFLAAGPVFATGTGVPGSRQHAAAALVDRALQHDRTGTIDGRRSAIADLEQAVRLAPGRPDYQLLLARVYVAAGFMRSARERFARVAALAPNDPEARFGLGRMWRRDYLKYLDTTSLVRAIDQLGWATRLDPSNTTGWVMLASLHLEHGDPRSALGAAERAWRESPRAPEALAALGSARWRLGDVEGADSAFWAAMPQLPDKVRRRFDDIAPLATEQDTARFNHLPAEAKYEYARRFWAELDPDLATPENEARLEYWARVAQAWSLWFDTRRGEWDERGEVYVRFGPPARQVYNPVGTVLEAPAASTSQFMFPMNVLLWNYPELGMSVTLQDRVLSEYYLLQRYPDREPDPHPDADSLAHMDMLATHGTRGLFPALPPGARRLPFAGQVARFEGERDPRLVATLEVRATPADSLLAEYVVMDSTERVTARGSRTLSPSACAADSFRVADFASDLPPGEYRVGLSVRGPRGRGSLRFPVTLPARDSVLALSDLVVTCGTPAPLEATVRLAANPAGRVEGDDPLTAYFEIYGLATDAGGQARFEIGWIVRSDERDPRIWLQRALAPRPATPRIETSRRESNAGPLRRQFVSVPVQALAPGRYRLEVTVRDLLSGRNAGGVARFTRAGAAK
jgi:GWxTD domain-containing protein